MAIEELDVSGRIPAMQQAQVIQTRLPAIVLKQPSKATSDPWVDELFERHRIERSEHWNQVAKSGRISNRKVNG